MLTHVLHPDAALDAAVRLAPEIPSAWGGKAYFRTMLAEHAAKPQQFFQHMPAMSPECAAACAVYFAVCAGHEVRTVTYHRNSVTSQHA